jgi:hypothetical protein
MTNEKFSTINPEFLTRWISAVNQAGIPQRAYNPPIKIIGDNPKNPSYTFGVIFNSYRLERPYQKVENTGNCRLCSELTDSLTNPYKNLALGISNNFLVTYNGFPHLTGFSMAVAKNVDGREKPMYNTRDLEGLASELDEVFSIANKLGLKVFHNTHGAGASIPGHEHWHLFDFGSAYDKVGRRYGFDAAEKIPLKKESAVRIMPDFPFAHLIFNPKDPERIVNFLKHLGEEIGGKYPCGHVPHSICQGEEGVLIVTNKTHQEKCIGSSDVAGHYFGCKSASEAENMTFGDYISQLNEILFRKQDINLEAFL